MRITSGAPHDHPWQVLFRRHDSLTGQTRWLFFLMGLVSIALTTLGSLFAQPAGPVPYLLVGAVVLVAVHVHRYTTGTAPLGAGLAEAGALLVFASACPTPSMVFACVFAGLWLRAMTGSTRGLVLDTLVVFVCLMLSAPGWALVPGHTGTVDEISLFGGLPTTTLTIAVARYLALGLIARERLERRDIAVANLGSALVGITARSDVLEAAWAVGGLICEASPGLRLVLGRQEGDRFRVLLFHGSFSSDPSGLMPMTVQPGGDGQPASLSSAAPLNAAAHVHARWTALPLPTSTDEWLLVGTTRKGRPEALAAIQLVINQACLSLENIAAHSDLKRQASTDALTGLANRAAFTAALGSLGDHAHDNYAVLFLDLDDFKIINDGMGHAVGDEVLRQVAERLRQVVRPQDLCARLGGDEFAILLLDVTADAVRSIAERLVARIGEPVHLGLHRALVGASIGAALAERDMPADATVGSADAAMYAAKAAGKNRVEVAWAAHATPDERARLEADLATASSRGEIVTHYQPIVSAADGSCTAVEALVRWEHPQRGLLLPGDFLAAAVRTGAIRDIGEQVLRQACTQLRAWDAAGRRLTLHVNVSVLQLRDAGFADTVRQCLADHGLTPERLVVETAGASLSDGDDAEATLLALRAQGVRLAVDDVGAGPSLMTALRSLPPDILKVSPTFTAMESPQDRRVLHAIVALADRLGLVAIVCGVERAEQERDLTAAGAGFLQGHRFAPAVPADQLTSWLAQRRPAASATERPAASPAAAPASAPAS